MRIRMLGGGLRIPVLLVVLLASALAVPVPSGERDEGLRILSSDWRIETVDTSQCGYFTSIAVDSHGLPHISYFEDHPNYTLKYARRTGEGWVIETVDPSSSNAGMWTSIALDGSDNPHISYFDDSYKVLKYARWNGTTWSIQTVDASGHTGEWTSLALDGNYRPHISYFGSGIGLKYARWTGSTWSIETVDTVGKWTSLALDSNDFPHIGYYDNSNGDLKYARWNGAKWEVETVDSVGDVGEYTSLDLDSSDRPHVSYYDSTNKDLRYSAWSGTAWTKEVLQSDDEVGTWTSISVDSKDHPHTSYRLYTWGNLVNDLMYAWHDGSDWNLEVVDYEHNVGGFTSIALDKNDLPHISYADGTHYDTKYATKADLTPSLSISLDIDPDTLNLKSKGRWITAYLSAENASVYDMNISSILLQDALAPERWDHQDDVLMLKFNRQDFKDTVQVGESVQVKITGMWEDGTAFEACDSIRVIDPGGK